jgi:hypothetical protein
MKTAELTPTAQKIDKLIKRIDESDIKIPAFQRGYVWKQNQVIELLESVVNEYPIPSILLWKSSDRLKSTRNIAGYRIPDRDEAYPVNYVLDGQQRLVHRLGDRQRHRLSRSRTCPWLSVLTHLLGLGPPAGDFHLMNP